MPMRVLLIALAICAAAFLVNVAGDLSAPAPSHAAPAVIAPISVLIPPAPAALRTQNAAAETRRPARRVRAPAPIQGKPPAAQSAGFMLAGYEEAAHPRLPSSASV